MLIPHHEESVTETSVYVRRSREQINLLVPILSTARNLDFRLCASFQTSSGVLTFHCDSEKRSLATFLQQA